MWIVYNEYGPIADFETESEAIALCEEENAESPDSHWIGYKASQWCGETRLNDRGYPKG